MLYLSTSSVPVEVFTGSDTTASLFFISSPILGSVGVVAAAAPAVWSASSFAADY